MVNKKRSEAHLRAEKKYADKRRGAPTFSSVRMDTNADKDFIYGVIEKYNQPKKVALLKAFELLDETLEDG